MPALRAYVVSHLGKYVPGKAMVVVVRAGMVVPFGARASTAAIATFYETLVMMAAGGLVAAAGFATAAGSERVDLELPVLGPVSLPVYGLAALLGSGAGAGVPGRGAAADLRPAGRAGQLAHPRGRSRGVAAPHGAIAGPGTPLVDGRLGAAGPEPARGGPGVRSRGRPRP